MCIAMSDSTDRDMKRADIANGEGDPDELERELRPDDEIIPPEQDPEASYPNSTGVVDGDDEEEGRLPPLGQELEAD
jgi:hypothetical protein